ncbi:MULTISPECIES: hypothetical protein [unclassified Bradyrhizobium]|uniref:hypothetical protein n=1 Tax=unclassified Bradyrhizobium TaxID=2631580 RepID=UPI0028EFC753|nr:MULTISPECIES: hypothetical protein [unclassified Bradyrhizobium]
MTQVASYPPVATSQQTQCARRLLDCAILVPVPQTGARYRSVKLVILSLAFIGKLAAVDAQTSSNGPGTRFVPSSSKHDAGKLPRAKRSLPPRHSTRPVPGTEERSKRCPPYSAYVVCK